MTKVFQIKVGKHQTGIIGLDEVLKEIAIKDRNLDDKTIGAAMVEKLSKKNYIPSTVVDLYTSTFVREYKKLIGEPITELSIAGIEIKVLGAGCPSCDRLEQDLMMLIEETGIDVNLEHVREFKEISKYGIAQSTASKHLKILEDAELVRSFKDGLWVNYSLSDGSGSPYSANMIGNLKHWLDSEFEIRELNQILPSIDRYDIVGK